MSIKHLWNRISRVGLFDDENVRQFREVIFLNRILAICQLVMLLFVPVEIIVNGVTLLPVVLLLNTLLLLPYWFHHHRKFVLARFLTIILGNLFVFGAGLVVGRAAGNYLAFIPIVLIGVILFKTRTQRLSVLLIGLLFYGVQQYLFTVIEPLASITPDRLLIFNRIFFVLSMLLTFILGFYFVGINREYEQIIEQQGNELSDKNRELTDSIRYARRIQQAILPPDEILAHCLPQSFVLYLPKDIVAGDFYWVRQLDGLVFFAVADCTGHGVPGAMLSVVCNGALNRSVFEFGLVDPALILNQARDIVVTEFEQSSEEIRDGMDISLGIYDPESKLLRWAGAHNPLVYIRNGVLHEVKADKQPVGKFAAELPFTTHQIQMQAGDQLYLFSDGFADQFGGEHGKKLKNKPFREILLDVHQLKPEQQGRALKSRFDEWKAGFEQVDDVCIMGIRIS